MTKFLSFLVTALLALPAFAQVDCNSGMLPLDDSAESTLSPRGFIKVVAAKEDQFSKALDRYGYAVDIEVETLTGDAVDGEFHRAAPRSSTSTSAARVGKRSLAVQATR